MKQLLILLFLSVGVFGASLIKTLQYLDIQVVHTYKEQSKHVIIKREINPKCLELGINHETVFSGDMAATNVPNECKKTFITTLGSVQLINLDGIKTVGELEVLEHIVKSQKEPEKYILLDSRRTDWFENLTIPSAVNIPYTEIKYDPDFPEDFEKLLQTLNIKKDDQKLDFSEAKKVVLFCNGSWCVQSASAIEYLIQLGYPKEKLLWYRGGLQEWMALGFTVIRRDLK
jgi:rhodanese-related sulfurtransferase